MPWIQWIALLSEHSYSLDDNNYCCSVLPLGTHLDTGRTPYACFGKWNGHQLNYHLTFIITQDSIESEYCPNLVFLIYVKLHYNVHLNIIALNLNPFKKNGLCSNCVSLSSFLLKIKLSGKDHYENKSIGLSDHLIKSVIIM